VDLVDMLIIMSDQVSKVAKNQVPGDSTAFQKSNTQKFAPVFKINLSLKAASQ